MINGVFWLCGHNGCIYNFDPDTLEYKKFPDIEVAEREKILIKYPNSLIIIYV